MTNNSTAELLHDKATRGGTLTEAEQAALEAWYKNQDAEEAARLAVPSAPSPTLAALRAEVSSATRQLSEVAERIQAQSEENERLRQQNAALSQRLIDSSPQTASSKTA